jgi:hypothetical protein
VIVSSSGEPPQRDPQQNELVWSELSDRMAAWWTRRRAWLAAIVAATIVAGSLTWVVAASASRQGPEEVVAAFFAAIVERDVDAALALLASTASIPIGDQAAFLHPDAIAEGWSVASVQEVSRDEWRARVRVRLASGHGHADADVNVDRDVDGRWWLASGLVEVWFPPSPLAYVHINERLVPLGEQYRGFPARFSVLPGPHRFYPPLDHYPSLFEGPGPTRGEVMVLPGDPDRQTHENALTVVPGSITATDALVERVNRELATMIDYCAEFTTAQPYRCPFGTDGYIDTPDGHRIDSPEALEWTVDEYPDISLQDARAEREPAGLRVVVENPGQVLLSGSGQNTERERGEFTIECDIVLDEQFWVVIDLHGEVRLRDGIYSSRTHSCMRE